MKTTKLANGFVRLTPKKGKRLLNTLTQQTYSEAVVKAEKKVFFKDV